MFDGKMELYNLADDIGEENDLSPAEPELVQKAESIMEKAHVPNPMWKIRK
jgi:hypothetical protein